VQSAGAYGLVNTRIGLPVRLNREGVKEIVKLPLRDSELAALGEAARNIAARIGELG
jgi:malate dehydrogenase